MGEGTAGEMAPAGGAGGMDVDGAASPAAGAEREPAPEAALGGGDDGDDDDDDDDEDFDEGAFDGLDGDEEEARFPLHAAVEAGDAGAIAELLATPAPPPVDHAAIAARVAAAGADAPEGLAEFLTQRAIEEAAEAVKGPDADKRDDEYLNTTALQLALLRRDAACAAALLDGGADVTMRLEGLPALHVAVAAASLPVDNGGVAAGDQIACVKLLLERGESASGCDDHGRLPLHIAAAAGLPDAVGVLLAAHEAQEGESGSLADALVAADREGNTPLHVAAYASFLDAGDSLKRMLARVSAPSDAQAAAGSGADDVHALLRQNKAGQTPLHAAQLTGVAECVDALLSAPGGAAAESAKDARGRTPAQCAPQAATAVGGTPPTLIVSSEVCANHHTVMPPPEREMAEDTPPENVLRYGVVAGERGVLRTSPFGGAQWAEAPRAALADVLRVHDWNYVQKLRAACASASDGDGIMPARCADLDSDTAVSRESAEAALHAVGGTIAAVDAVLTGKAPNAFVVARPPGHHAGPKGVVTNVNDPYGSHGFCLLNNVACGAAYALCCHRASGVRKVALLDFDVHHGNGTQACVAAVMPQRHRHKMSVPDFGPDVSVSWETFKPWVDEGDEERVFFASVQGFGPRDPEAGPEGGFVYPGSGSTAALLPEALREPERDSMPSWQQLAFDPNEARESAPKPQPPAHAPPRMVNVGIPGPGRKSRLWRKAWRDHVLPALAAFDPDAIFISAGFDAHRKDAMNCNYVGLDDEDYAWVTHEILKVANKCCDGRVVSVLEGGYRIQGELVSPFARSVASHVGALMHPAGRHERWSEADAAADREKEAREAEARRARKEAAQAEAAALAADANANGGASADAGGTKRALEGEPEEAPPSGRRRRGGAPVDYVALAKKLDEERQQQQE